MVRTHLESIRSISSNSSIEKLREYSSIISARHLLLDIRFVVEELMLLSVAANKKSGKLISKSISKQYKAAKIAQKLEKLNPDYFPIAVSIIDADEPNFAGRIALRKGDHLTSDLAIKYWNKAGNILHANFKKHSQEEIAELFSISDKFLKQATSLLETFEVDVSGEGMWIGEHLNFNKKIGPELFYATFS
jgi:hypothetical protein